MLGFLLLLLFAYLRVSAPLLLLSVLQFLSVYGVLSASLPSILAAISSIPVPHTLNTAAYFLLFPARARQAYGRHTQLEGALDHWHRLNFMAELERLDTLICECFFQLFSQYLSVG